MHGHRLKHENLHRQLVEAELLAKCASTLHFMASSACSSLTPEMDLFEVPCEI